MSSQKIPVAKLKLPLGKKPIPTAQIFCPPNTFSMENGVDSRVSTADAIERSSKISLSGTAAAMNQIKDLLQVVSESAVEMNMVSELNGSELSLLNMLSEQKENVKLFDESTGYMDSSRDGNAERKLREEVMQLKKDLIMKSSLIEKLIKENDGLRKEMDEVLSTVEDAKAKIGVKLSECNQRIKELEGEVKTLSDENKQYQEQLQQKTKELSLKSNIKKLDDQVGRYYSDAHEKVGTFYQKLNDHFDQFTIVSSPKSQYQNTISHIEDIQKEPVKVRSRHGSPKQVRPHLSPPKLRNLSQARNVRHLKVANNSPVTAERAGAINNSNRRNKTMALHHIQDSIAMNKSEGNCVRQFNQSESYVMNRSPKVGFTPQAKIKLVFPTESADC